MAEPTTPDRLSAALEEIRGRRERAGHSFVLAPTAGARALADSAEDVPVLLAALDAVLALANDTHVMLANHETGHREPVAWDLDPDALRAAISAELLGEGESGGTV